MYANYYQILGIRSDADLGAIKGAYRKRAMECHPDRGGSHEQMLLINEAFQILSNPDTRSRYDAARSGQDSQQAQTDRDRARKNADNYPRDWANFQTWLDAIYDDFARQESGGKSYSGSVFQFIGGVIGCGVFAGIIWLICGAFDWDSDQHGSWQWLIVLGGKAIGLKILIVCVGGCIGAALALHKVIGDAIRPLSSKPQQQPPGNQNNNFGSSQNVVVSCPKCAQRLRAPMGRNEVRLRCTSCGHQFVHREGVGA